MMRKVLFSVAAISAMAATPAFADEGRFEARGGVISSAGDSEAFAGMALGWDFDLGSTAFVGAEISGDKVLVDGTRVAIGFTSRLGARFGSGRLYVDGGYTTKFCDVCDGNWHVGAGYQHRFGPVYGKVEYRRYIANGPFTANADAFAVGLGGNF